MSKNAWLKFSPVGIGSIRYLPHEDASGAREKREFRTCYLFFSRTSLRGFMVRHDIFVAAVYCPVITLSIVCVKATTRWRHTIPSRWRGCIRHRCKQGVDFNSAFEGPFSVSRYSARRHIQVTHSRRSRAHNCWTNRRLSGFRKGSRI